MKMFQNGNAPKTTKACKKQTGEHQETVKTMRRSFFKTGAVVIAAFVSLLCISAAWFMKNTNVSSTGMNISADDNRTFYLATRRADQQGIYDDNSDGDSPLSQALEKYNRIQGDQIEFLGLPQYSVGTTVITGTDGVEYIVGDTEGISLMVNSTSNMNNTGAEDYVGPGARGELTFYLIPKVSGEHSVNVTISLAAYQLRASGGAGGQGTASAERLDGSAANTALRNLLCGHILLFQGKNSDGDYINQIFPVLEADGAISFCFEETSNWEINKPIAVTVYWVWPYRFENLVFPGQDDSVFATAGSAQAEFLVWLNRHKDYFAYRYNAGTQDLEDAGADMTNSVFAKWNSGYNRGDQLIGDTVAYFAWTIRADG